MFQVQDSARARRWLCRICGHPKVWHYAWHSSKKLQRAKPRQVPCVGCGCRTVILVDGQPSKIK